MKNIVIYFGSNAAIEILSYLKDLSYCTDSYKIYIYEKSNNLLKKKELKKIYKKVNFIVKENELFQLKNSKFIIASGDSNLRYKSYRNLKKENVKFFTIVHPLAYVSQQTKISEGSIISPFTTVAPFAKIGPNCYLNHYSSIGHHSEIGHSCVISPFAKVNGNAKLGKRVLLGTTSSVLSGIKIGNDSKLSSNSVLRNNLKSNSLAHGNPAHQAKIY